MASGNLHAAASLLAAVPVALAARELGSSQVRLMLDLCSGLGGASQAMRDRGWIVVRVDNDPEFSPDILADVREWSWSGERPDLVWASPPCVEFSRESMPWSRTGQRPDMSLILACKRIIDEINPRYWILENVRGAVHWFRPQFGLPAEIVGSFYLWGHFPPLGKINISWRKKGSFSGAQSSDRARIPYLLSLAVAKAIEAQPLLFEV
jgi:hypothetical protein